MEECEWIKEYDHLKINGIDYYFRCSWCWDKKAPNNDNPSMQLVFTIWNDTEKCFIDWNNFKCYKCGTSGSLSKLCKEFGVYQEYFNFIKNKLDKIDNEEIALSICDWTVNSGAWWLKKAQQTLNELGYNLVVDGIFGNKTLQALNTVDVDKFLEIYHNKQRLFYNNIVKNNPTQKKFLQGWLNRVSRKENYLANNMEKITV